MARRNLTPCPDCGAPVSRRAVACPQCGCPINASTPASEAPAPPKTNATQESDQVIQVAGWIIAILCALALPTGIAQFMPGLIANPGKLNENAAKAFIQVFSLTGPLVAATALVSLCALGNWLEKQGMWLVPGVFLVAWVIGRLGVGAVPALPDHVPAAGHPAAMVVTFVVQGYADVTGWFLTIVSLALGGFLGCVAFAKMPEPWRRGLDETFGTAKKPDSDDEAGDT